MKHRSHFRIRNLFNMYLINSKQILLKENAIVKRVENLISVKLDEAQRSKT